jgi:hypothetical protein
MAGHVIQSSCRIGNLIPRIPRPATKAPDCPEHLRPFDPLPDAIKGLTPEELDIGRGGGHPLGGLSSAAEGLALARKHYSLLAGTCVATQLASMATTFCRRSTNKTPLRSGWYLVGTIKTPSRRLPSPAWRRPCLRSLPRDRGRWLQQASP